MFGKQRHYSTKELFNCHYLLHVKHFMKEKKMYIVQVLLLLKTIPKPSH